MVERKKGTSFTIGEETYAILQNLATERTQAARLNGDTRKTYIGDVIREAVEEYLQKRGFDVSVEVDRGGWRGAEKRDA